MAPHKIRVLLCDDSATIRSALKIMIRREADMEVVAAARNGAEGARMVGEYDPDLVVMDIEMPEMDGIQAVRVIMEEHPVPVLMFSSVAKEAAPKTLEALDAGAVDFVTKDSQGSALDIGGLKTVLLEKIRQFARRDKGDGPSAATKLLRNRQTFHSYLSDLKDRAPDTATRKRLEAHLQRATGKVNLSLEELVRQRGVTQAPTAGAPGGETFERGVTIEGLPRRAVRLIAIGGSTGGPQALRTVLSRLPMNIPVPVVVVQHMPGTFTESFASRLRYDCEARVGVAANYETLKPGEITIAPGGSHFRVITVGGELRSELSPRDVPDVLHKPSVDVMFESVEKTLGGDALAVILTGMGRDGASGAKALHLSGATVIAQDEATSVVYGMPRAVVEEGAADLVLPVHEIGDVVAQLAWKGEGKRRVP